MIQEIIAFTVLVLAIVYLMRKFVFKSKRKKKDCGNGDCGCS